MFFIMKYYDYIFDIIRHTVKILCSAGKSIKIDVIIRNLPSDLIFNFSAGLETGNYQLEIRNKTHKTYKQLKNFIFSQTLTLI